MEQLEHSGFGHVVCGDFTLQVQPNHCRLAGHVANGVEDVLPELPPVRQLDSRDPDPLLTDLPGAGGVASGRHGPDVHHVDKGGAPAHDLVLVMDGGYHVQVGLVDRGHIGVVEQKKVVGVDIPFLPEPLDNALDGVPRAGNVPQHVHAGGEDVTIGQIERRHVVLHLRGVDRAPHPLQGGRHLIRDLMQAMGKDLEGYWVDALDCRVAHDALPTLPRELPHCGTHPQSPCPSG